MKTTLLIIGPHWIGVLVTLSLILVSTGCFLAKYMIKMPWYDTVVTLGLCSMTLFYFFQTTCSDPGIVRSQTKKDVKFTEDESEVAKLRADNVAIMEVQTTSSAGDGGPRRRHSTSRYRFCEICSMKQDRLTNHCNDCGVCVAGQDHHCLWMGKCIGQGNIHAFKMFSVSWVLYVSFVLLMTITSMDWSQKIV